MTVIDNRKIVFCANHSSGKEPICISCIIGGVIFGVFITMVICWIFSSMGWIN